MKMQTTPLTITVTLVLSQREQAHILQNSIERVLNNAIFVGEKACASKDEATSERGFTLFQDCEDLKEITTKLWNSARNEIFKARS